METINCLCCKENLKYKGALLISPPYEIVTDRLQKYFNCDVVNKYHICNKCYTIVMNMIVDRFNIIEYKDGIINK